MCGREIQRLLKSYQKNGDEGKLNSNSKIYKEFCGLVQGNAKVNFMLFGGT